MGNTKSKIVRSEASSKIVQSSSKWHFTSQSPPSRPSNAIAGPSRLAPLSLSSSESSSSDKIMNNDCGHDADACSSLYDTDVGYGWGFDSPSLAAALELQQYFDMEDLQLREQMQTLAASLPRSFCCAICMEDQLVDYSVDLECKHSICRTCIRGHIFSKIEEHCFPVLCPVCMTEKTDRQPAAISGLLVQQIGVDERQYAIWEEMELSQLSVLLHCRKCQRSVLVDRQEHDESRVLDCPLPDCDHMWCKACQEALIIDGPPHSCEGIEELDKLMKQRGWRYCPNCKTPVQRDGGCTHMTCISPACNTHFCYTCGQNIIRSALTSDIQIAVTAHYRVCKLFDSPEE
ncbi:hypothetical protein F4604DRAFT_372892 [Suillus subluteus]|nr:hypothetical protein F4604DRAFT_372892 [Suillus subluteus]